MNKCPYCDEIVSRPLSQLVATTNADIVVLVSCPSCLKIIGVTRL